jgi:hypothetical protein
VSGLGVTTLSFESGRRRGGSTATSILSKLNNGQGVRRGPRIVGGDGTRQNRAASLIDPRAARHRA